MLKLCDDQFILAASNIQNTPDAQLAQPALEVLRSQAARFRVEVKPENLAMDDFAQMKQERAGFMQGLTGFLQAAAPVMQTEPGAVPYLLEILKWSLGAYRGASQIEGVLDQAIQAMKAKLAQPPPPPNPEQAMQMQADQQKAQLDVHVAQTKAGIEIQKLQGKHQIDQQRLALDAQRAQLETRKMVAQARIQAEQQALQQHAAPAPAAHPAKPANEPMRPAPAKRKPQPRKRAS
jgi:hypothetical protein